MSKNKNTYLIGYGVCSSSDNSDAGGGDSNGGDGVGKFGGIAISDNISFWYSLKSERSRISVSQSSSTQSSSGFESISSDEDCLGEFFVIDKSKGARLGVFSMFSGVLLTVVLITKFTMLLSPFRFFLTICFCFICK